MFKIKEFILLLTNIQYIILGKIMVTFKRGYNPNLTFEVGKTKNHNSYGNKKKKLLNPLFILISFYLG